MTDRFVNNYLLAQLAILSHDLSDEFYRYLRSQGMTPSRWRILLNLSGLDGLYITQLSDCTFYEQSRITKSVQNMERDKLVCRRQCDIDKRRVKVFITDAGEQALTPLIEAAKQHEKNILGKISKEDAKTLRKILQFFVKNHINNLQESERVDNRRLLKRAKLEPSKV